MTDLPAHRTDLIRSLGRTPFGSVSSTSAFCAEVLAKAISEVQHAVGVELPYQWDERGRRILAGKVASEFWGDPSDEVEMMRSRLEEVHAYLCSFLELQRADPSIKDGPFCLRIGGTSSYVTGWNVDPVKFDTSNESQVRRILLRGADFAKTEEVCGHPDTLIFSTHFDAFVMARLIERLDGTQMSVEEWRLPLQVSLLEIEITAQPTGTSASNLYDHPPPSTP